MNKGKKKVICTPCTGPEFLYRPYCPQGEQMYRSTLSRPRHQKGVRGQRHTPAAVYPRNKPGTHCTGGWWNPGLVWTGAEILAPHRDLITGPSSSQSVTIPTTLLGPHNNVSICAIDSFWAQVISARPLGLIF